MVKYGLKPAPIGSFGNYSTLVNPGVTNEFATAGFRVGHSLVQGILKYVHFIASFLKCNLNRLTSCSNF